MIKKIPKLVLFSLLLLSSPQFNLALASLNDDEVTTNNQQIILNPNFSKVVFDIPELFDKIVNYWDKEALFKASLVSCQWNAWSEERAFNINRDQILPLFAHAPRLQTILDSFFTDFKDKDESKMFLFVLNKFLNQNFDFFPNAKGQAGDVTDKRLGYTLGMIMCSAFKGGDNFIFDREGDFYDTDKNKKELMIFLSDLLRLVRNVDMIWLNSTYYNPLDRMNEELAEILATGFRDSCVKKIGLIHVDFSQVPDSLPVFLNHAAQNENLKIVDLSLEGYRYDDTVVHRLIQNVPGNLGFKLILRSSLDFEHPEGDKQKRNDLKKHFGDNIEFKKSLWEK